MNDYRDYMNADYNAIYHHGIQGMKWGRRRYQNDDGTLTAEGRARYGLSEQKAGELSREEATRKANLAASNDYQNISKAANAGSQIGSRGGNIMDRAASRERDRAKKQIDLSNMSDDEIRQRVNRMNIERQYKDLATADVGAGKTYAGDIMRDVGDLVSIAGSIATIAATIYMIKKSTGV